MAGGMFGGSVQGIFPTFQLAGLTDCTYGCLHSCRRDLISSTEVAFPYPPSKATDLADDGAEVDVVEVGVDAPRLDVCFPLAPKFFRSWVVDSTRPSAMATAATR